MSLDAQQRALCRQIAGWIASAKRVVAFTGAGISTESGIPDFRSPGGIWANSTPVLYSDFIRSPAARQEAWRQKAVAFREFRDCGPNRGHELLAEWESQGRLRAVVTQNIDGLHQRAGSQRVIEVHGTALVVSCLECGARYPAVPLMERFDVDQRVPSCEKCGGLLKHATISFGQPLDQETWREAFSLCEMADVVLTLGSSLVVEPAASLPRAAAEGGGRLVIVNRDPTPLDPMAGAVIRAGIGETLSAIDAELAK